MHFPRFIYHDKLEPRIWNPDTSINLLVQNSLMMIAWSYIAFLQQNGFPFDDSDICDVIVHGSTSNYYYDNTSDIDLCIVANFEHLYSTFPPINLNVVLRSMLMIWKRNFKLRVAGRGVDITIVDVANPQYIEGRHKVGGEYSLMHEKWIKQSVRLSDTELRTMRRVARKKYRKYKQMYHHIMA